MWGDKSRFYSLKIESHANIGYILLPYKSRQLRLFLLHILL